VFKERTGDLIALLFEIHDAADGPQADVPGDLPLSCDLCWLNRGRVWRRRIRSIDRQMSGVASRYDNEGKNDELAALALKQFALDHNQLAILFNPG
jgi:hypothetical protein